MTAVRETWQEDAAKRVRAEVAPSPWIFAYAAAAIALFAVFQALTAEDVYYAFTKEAGPIEVASATLWGVAAVAALSFASYTQLAFRWPVVVGFALLGARELDWDKAFLSEGILQLRLYSGDSPLTEKLIGGAVIALILTVLWKLSRKAGFFLNALRRERAGWAWMISGTVLLAVFAKTIDGIGRKMEGFGVTLTPETIAVFSVVEEVMELVFVLGMILAVCMFEARSRR